MGRNEKVSKYLKNAEEWLNASKKLGENNPEPAAFNALHGAELAAKAALRRDILSDLKDGASTIHTLSIQG